MVVIGEGSVSVTPDYAQVESGVTTRASTVKQATDANSRFMSAITSTLTEAGIASPDVQTSRFSIQPVYAPQEPRTEPRLTGYSVSNQVRVKICRSAESATGSSRRGRSDQCGKRDVPGIGAVESARSGARGGHRRCPPQG